WIVLVGWHAPPGRCWAALIQLDKPLLAGQLSCSFRAPLLTQSRRCLPINAQSWAAYLNCATQIAVTRCRAQSRRAQGKKRTRAASMGRCSLGRLPQFGWQVGQILVQVASRVVALIVGVKGSGLLFYHELFPKSCSLQ